MMDLQSSGILPDFNCCLWVELCPMADEQQVKIETCKPPDGLLFAGRIHGKPGRPRK